MDAYGLDDYFLNSALGVYDGDVYTVRGRGGKRRADLRASACSQEVPIARDINPSPAAPC